MVFFGRQASLPHMASFAREASLKSEQVNVSLPESINTVATRGEKIPKNKLNKSPVVEAVKASKGTWAFRLRWNSLPNRPVEYITRVTDATYNLITADKETYERYKRQILQIAVTGSVPTGDETGSSTTGII